MAKAPALGAGDREFESHHPEKILKKLKTFVFSFFGFLTIYRN
ncbi:conserved hypothetical protein [Borreliella burgdorferi WI91-23]|nr:conserved hypothetical protein [Borreliella burgdorferi WI91-23]